MDDLRRELITAFRWRSDPPVWPESRAYYADDSGWFASATIVAHLGPALAALHDAQPTVVMGTESKGMALAALTAVHLGIGTAQVRKEPDRTSHTDEWFTQRTIPDYRDRNMLMAVRKSQVRGSDRVLFVDDWVDTGGQMIACHQLTVQAGASWLGAAVIVDGLEDSAHRRKYDVRSLLHLRDL
ncbi:phosphoribosyltransferase family protein [Terrabacter sp. C0L_2]|uniref:phosphoribosyltransferase family protein n=1 Tax=Terrabacter sp. C0L_2 TaxID=3108389 RepID=UPI002ED60AAF|nr:phosphoribosyltransferase family protein [Terrabacter sp. C0L_2]